MSTLTATITGVATPTGSQSITKHTNSQGQTAQITDNAGTITAYTYDAIGNLTQVTGRTSTGTPIPAINETMVYDLRGRKISATNSSLNGSYTYEYQRSPKLTPQVQGVNLK